MLKNQLNQMIKLIVEAQNFLYTHTRALWARSVDVAHILFEI